MGSELSILALVHRVSWSGHDRPQITSDTISSLSSDGQAFSQSIEEEAVFSQSIEEAAAAALAAIELEEQLQEGGCPSPGEDERERPSIQEAASMSRTSSSKR